MSATGDAQSAFFQRMTGLGFAIMSLGYAKCGVSKDAWIKQTMIFHVGTCVEIELPELPGQRRVDGMGRLKFDFHTGRLDSDLLPPVRERRRHLLHALGLVPRAAASRRVPSFPFGAASIASPRFPSHGSLRSPNRHQRCSRGMGLHGNGQEQDEVDVSTVRGTLRSLTPRRPDPFDS